MENLLNETRTKMDKAIDHLEREFKKVRTGRANPSMLDSVMVDYYGNPTPVNQVGNVTVPEPQMIVITPWEKNILPEIERAIQKADLGITPQNDGNVVRLPIPPLTEERRKDLVKQVKKMTEESKVGIRAARKDANDSLKQMLKDKEISEDDEKKQLVKVQELTDVINKKVDSLTEEKEKELMEV
ncbi:MAG: ribosome recycling factor [SAR324 cluster bacterium]|nr:ribosome recycling factor [SAR324 cluster bacterium]